MTSERKAPHNLDANYAGIHDDNASEALDYIEATLRTLAGDAEAIREYGIKRLERCIQSITLQGCHFLQRHAELKDSHKVFYGAEFWRANGEHHVDFRVSLYLIPNAEDDGFGAQTEADLRQRLTYGNLTYRFCRAGLSWEPYAVASLDVQTERSTDGNAATGD